MRNQLQTWATTGILLLTTAASARAELITNGGFETGDFYGWGVGNNAGTMFVGAGNPASGFYAAQIAGYTFSPNTLLQSFQTSAGQMYTLGFERAIENGSSDAGLIVRWNGSIVYEEIDPGPQAYQQFSVDVIGTGTSDGLSFYSYNNSGNIWLDNVSLNVSSVPEPSAGVLSSIVLIGVSGVRSLRRRNAAAAA